MSLVPIPAPFKHAVKQGWSFKQQARQVCTAVSNFEGLEQSPTGGHAREPELLQVPSAAVEDMNESNGTTTTYGSFMTEKGFVYQRAKFGTMMCAMRLRRGSEVPDFKFTASRNQ
jgi:hypothetical protein